MSGLSLFEKTTLVRDRVGNYSLTNADTFRVAIPRATLTDELKLICTVTQGFTGIPTAVNPERFIKRISVETSQKVIDLSGMMAYRIAEFYEQGALVETVLAATSTCKFSLDLFFSNPSAKLDLMTALDSTSETNFTLVIEMASDTANGFVGGTVPLVATMAVELVNYNLPAMMGSSDLIASERLFMVEKSKPYTVAGILEGIAIEVKNNTRAIAICVEDMTGGVFVGYRNDILKDVLLKDGGTVAFQGSFDLLRHDNYDERNANMLGFAVLDFHNDEIGFLNLNGVQDLILGLEAVSTLPAGVTAYRVTVAQIFSREK